MSSPELPRPDENPFQPPQQPVRYSGPMERDDPMRQRRRRVLLILLGLVLVPIATVIGGFVGCFAGLGALTAVGNEETGIVLFFIAIGLGAIVAAGVTIFLLVLIGTRR